MKLSANGSKIDVIPKDEWKAFRVHQQRLKWAKLGEVMGERMNQYRIEEIKPAMISRCS